MDQKGQALVELLIAMAIAGIVATAGVEGFVASRESYLRTSQYSEASAILNEQLEALRSIRERSWSNITTNGTYHATVSGSQWILTSGAETGCDLCRQIVIANTCRDGSDVVVECPSGTTDPSTKKITVTISWTEPQSGTVEQTIYLSRHLSNTTWVETDRSDFNQGTTINTATTNDGGGTVQLDTGTPQSATYDWPFTTAGNYTYDSNKIEVTGGVAQLVDQGGGGLCSGTATACAAFNTQPTCLAQAGCVWGGGASGTTTNPSFATGSTGWTYADWETSNKVSGDWQATGGNPNGYIRVVVDGQKNQTISGYWRQSFVTTVTNPTGTVGLDWRIPSYSATGLVSYYLYVFVENVSGAPTLANYVWRSPLITSTTSWATVSNLDVSSKLGAAGTYYLKVVARGIYDSTNSPGTTIGAFDNVQLNWSKSNPCSGTPQACNTFGNQSSCQAQGGCSWTGSPVYPTDRPTINPTLSLTVSNLTSWDGLTETATKNGGQIYYQLSDDDGTTWYYWVDPPTRDWVVAGSGNYNTASDVNSNIDEFPVTSGKIMFKAFLESNGSQLVILDNAQVGYTTTTGYQTSGTFESQTFNAGANVGFNYLTWGSTKPSGTALKFQFATNSDGSTWNYVGSDGTSGTYFESAGAVPLGVVSAQYIRYKVYFTGDGFETPVLEDVTVNYSP